MKINVIKSVIVASLLSGLMLVTNVNAASACKGLENSACKSNSACGWVNEYQRKDGRKVKGFCRTSTRGKAKAKTASDTTLGQNLAKDS